MKIFNSNTHRAELSDNGILEVFLLKGKKIQETSFNGKKVSTTEHTAKHGALLLRNLLAAMDTLPLIRASCASSHTFNVDYEAGIQRWKGIKSTAEIRKALEKCNFDNKDIKFIIKFCKKTSHLSLPRVG